MADSQLWWGFTLDLKTGFWSKKPGEDGPKDLEGAQLLPGVQPFVQDTRNLLLAKVNLDSAGARKEDFLASLSFALQRGMQALFQVEEQEIAVSRIGEDEERRILYWEAAEGGNGVWARLMQEPDALAQVASEALKICHFNPQTGDDEADKDMCSRACYRCLLSYSNQMDHPKLDRLLIRDYLLSMSKAVTTKVAKGRTYEEQYDWLQKKRDLNSSLESQFLSILSKGRRRLPDRAQYRPEKNAYCEADFFYDRDGLKGVAVFIDGPHHDEPECKKKDLQERAKLDDAGYRVLVIRYDSSLEEQIASNEDVFGPGAKAAGQ
ncbi:MAG: box helicase domain protein [Acidobacteriales bacterium]|nr:box helicase domain protein [Terriglobales bacterium]